MWGAYLSRNSVLTLANILLHQWQSKAYEEGVRGCNSHTGRKVCYFQEKCMIFSCQHALKCRIKVRSTPFPIESSPVDLRTLRVYVTQHLTFRSHLFSQIAHPFPRSVFRTSWARLKFIFFSKHAIYIINWQICHSLHAIFTCFSSYNLQVQGLTQWPHCFVSTFGCQNSQ